NEMIEAVARIARAVQVPVTADIEYAYAAAPDAVADMVLRVIAAGAVGINIEDHLPGAPDLVDLTLQADKISAVVRAASIAGVRVVVNGRTDGGGAREAWRRAREHRIRGDARVAGARSRGRARAEVTWHLLRVYDQRLSVR